MPYMSSPYPFVDSTSTVNNGVCRPFLVSYTWSVQHFMEGHAKSGPISRLPLVTISDSSNLLRDVPVCQVLIIVTYLFTCILPFRSLNNSLFLQLQPYHLELNFFNKENRVVQYPVRAFYLDGFNLMAHNLSTGADNLYKKLYSTVLTIH